MSISLKKIQIIFFGDQWDDLWRRRQQLSWRLSQINIVSKVIYIEETLTFVSLMKYFLKRVDIEIKTRWRRVLFNRSLVFQPSNKIYVITPITFLPYINSRMLIAFEGFCRKWIQKFLLKQLRKSVRISNSIVWVSVPYVPLGLVEGCKSRLLWYDCTEDFSDMHAVPENIRWLIKRNDKHLTKHADVVSAVSRELYDRKKSVHPSVYWIPNAVDVDLFKKKVLKEPGDLQSIPRPRLTFVGFVDEHQDWNLIHYLTEQHPEWSIVLIGPMKLRKTTPGDFESSVYFLGKKPYKELPNYLYHSDVCIQFYRPGAMNDTRNSQKVFLYLASGKPIVSTRSADVETIDRFVQIADTKQEFVHCVEKALAGDTDEARKGRIEAANKNSWESRKDLIASILMKQL